MFRNISVVIKLNALLGLLALALLVVGGMALNASSAARERNASNLQWALDVGAARTALHAALGAARQQGDALRAGAADGAAQLALVKKHDAELTRQLDALSAAAAKSGMAAAPVEEARRAQAEFARQAIERLNAAGGAAIALPDPPAPERIAQLAAGIDQFAQQERARRDAGEAGQWTTLLAGIAALALVLIAVGGWLRLSIRESILRSIRAAAHVVGRVAEGDLTVRVGVKAHGETQKMLQGLETMTRDLRTLVSEVTRGAHIVADTAAQISQGNLDLSQRTEEQASTLEETASSMEQLTSTVAQNADNARQASELAVAASQVARKGGQVVGQVVSTMTDISQSSRKIGDIIGVIDGIAFQTNILALNAAVEAARAGEQGRGFAVVAAEVRSLAQRSAAAAKEIKTLINDSVSRVEAGTKLVDAAGKTMDEIVGSVKKVSDLIAEIAAASKEQSSGIGQINTAVAQMEQVVQQNASLVEEASAATESMKEQAAALLHAVSRFQLGEDSPAIAPIQVRAGAALPPAQAARIAATPRAQGGEWREF